MPGARTFSAVLALAMLFPAALPQTAVGATIHGSLTQPISRVRFNNAALSDALNLPQLSGQIQIDWPALREVGVLPASQVSLDVEAVTAAQALDLILNRVEGRTEPLSWFVQGNAVHVTTQRKILRGSNLPRRTSAGSTLQTAPTVRRSAAPPASDFLLQEVTLSDAIDFFRNAAGVNIFVNWNALRFSGIDRETPVTVVAHNITLAKALDLVLDSLNAGRGRLDSIYWVIDGNVVIVSTGEDLNRDMVVRTYDVSDLLMVIPQFVGPRGSISGSDSSAAGSSGGSGSSGSSGLFSAADSQSTPQADDEAALRMQASDQLISIIRDSIGDEFWQPVGRGSISIVRGRMIVTQSRLGLKLMERAFSR